MAHRANGNTYKDLEENYASDAVLLCEHGAKHGHSGVAESANRLKQQLEGGGFEIQRVVVQGEFALLLWHGETVRTLIENGVDSFVIRDGRIVMQSVFYSIRDK